MIILKIISTQHPTHSEKVCTLAFAPNISMLIQADYQPTSLEIKHMKETAKIFSTKGIQTLRCFMIDQASRFDELLYNISQLEPETMDDDLKAYCVEHIGKALSPFPKAYHRQVFALDVFKRLPGHLLHIDTSPDVCVIGQCTMSMIIYLFSHPELWKPEDPPPYRPRLSLLDLSRPFY